MLRKYTYNINKNITPHKLRSTAATNLLEQTGDISLVAEVLGHKNLQNTRRYAKVSNEKKINAANILGGLVSMCVKYAAAINTITVNPNKKLSASEINPSPNKVARLESSSSPTGVSREIVS